MRFNGAWDPAYGSTDRWMMFLAVDSWLGGKSAGSVWGWWYLSKMGNLTLNDNESQYHLDGWGFFFAFCARREFALMNMKRIRLKTEGTAVLTAIGGLLVLLTLAGLWVRRGAFKSLVRLPRFGRGWRLGFSDVHQSVGVASMVFLLVIGLSGVWLAALAIGKLVDGGAKPPSIHKPERIRVASPLLMDDAASIARDHLDVFEARYVRFPDARNGVIRVSGSVPGTSVYGPYASRVGIDVATGNVVASRDLRIADRMTKLKCLAESLHYGSFGSTWVKGIYGLASVAFGLLCILGFWFGYRGGGR